MYVNAMHYYALTRPENPHLEYIIHFKLLWGNKYLSVRICKTAGYHRENHIPHLWTSLLHSLTLAPWLSPEICVYDALFQRSTLFSLVLRHRKIQAVWHFQHSVTSGSTESWRRPLRPQQRNRAFLTCIVKKKRKKDNLKINQVNSYQQRPFSFV